MISSKKMDVFLDAEFHHFGLAVPLIDEKLDQVFDPVQKATIAFIEMNGTRVELVKPETADSPARNFVRKGIYHVCFEVNNIKECIVHAENQGFKCIAPPFPAKAFKGKEIAWLINSRFGLIELLQK